MNKNLLPCPFCGAELQHRTFRVVFADAVWEHPKDTDCPLSKTGLGDPLSIFDNQSDIESWNKRTPPAQPHRKPLSFSEVTVIEERVYMKTTHKGKPAFEYAQALIRAVEAAHGIKEKNA